MSNNILIFIYIFLDVLPFAIPRYYLFLDKLAIPVKWLAFLLISISIFEAFGFIYLINQPWCIEVYLLVYRYIFVFMYAILSFIIIKDYFPKSLFIYLLMLSYGAFVVGNSHFIEARFFPLVSEQYPYLVNNITKIVLLAVTYPILFYFLKNYFSKVMNVISSDIWKYIWIIPLIFCTITSIYSANVSSEEAAKINFILLRYLNLIGAFFISFILLKTLKQTEINTRLEENISVAVDLKIPTDTFIADLDFCIILGNCLENAIEGCKKITEGEKFISIKSKMTNYMIGFTIDNSFSGEIIKEDNDFVSTKKSKNHGIGISSVQAVASKYDGTAKFEVDALNNVFKASILLKNNVSN